MKHFLYVSACLIILAGCSLEEEEDPYCHQWRNEYQQKYDNALGALEEISELDPRSERDQRQINRLRIQFNSRLDEMENLAGHMRYKGCKKVPEQTHLMPIYI